MYTCVTRHIEMATALLAFYCDSTEQQSLFDLDFSDVDDSENEQSTPSREMGVPVRHARGDTMLSP